MRTFSQTELKSYLRCRRRHDFSYTQMLKKPKVSKPLRYGTAWHNGMENYYGKELSKDEVIWHAQEDIVPPPLDDEDEYVLDQLQVKQECAKIEGHLGAYFNYYKGLEEWEEVYDTEIDFEVPTGIFANGQEIGYKGRFDMIVVDANDKYWLVEHKTSADLNLSTAANLRLDFQTSFYMLAARLMHYMDSSFPSISGVIYSVTRKSGLRLKQKVFDTEFSDGTSLVGGTKSDADKWLKNSKVDHEKAQKAPPVRISQEVRSEAVSELADRVRKQMDDDPEKYFFRETIRVASDHMIEFGEEVLLLCKEIVNGPTVVPNYQECKFCQFHMLCSNPKDTWPSLIQSSYIVKSPTDFLASAGRS